MLQVKMKIKTDHMLKLARILIIGSSESGKTISLLNLFQQDNKNLIDKIYLYAKDLEEPKYQFLIKKKRTSRNKKFK